MFQRPRGTRDYLPEDMAKRREVSERIREVFELYGYGEILTPAFEHLELLEAKAGEEVKEQIYWFTDKAGRKLGLRFELTTSIARVVAQNPGLPKPLRFYYIQPVWRYEEPQRGRLREFWQAGIELMGVGSAPADAEVVAVTVRALRRAGLSSLEVRINERRVVESLLISAGLRPERLGDALRALDKLERKGRAYVEGELAKLGLGERAGRVLDAIMSGGSNEEKLNRMEEELRGCEEGVRGLERLAEILDELKEGYGISSPEVLIDYSIVRGLAYYTGFVFEVKALKALDVGSVAGGGRYDDLVKVVGGPQLPATGMAIGLERLIEALKAEGAFEGFNYAPATLAVVPVKREMLRYAARVAEELRARGVKVLLDISGRKLSSALESIGKLGIPLVVIVGRREVEEGVYTLKVMEEWKEVKAPLDRVAEIALEVQLRRSRAS